MKRKGDGRIYRSFLPVQRCFSLEAYFGCKIVLGNKLQFMWAYVDSQLHVQPCHVFNPNFSRRRQTALSTASKRAADVVER